jgi:hypothetical protein
VWKQAIVVPVFKKGVAGDVNNYRPISLTCICCKVMEDVIKGQMLDFLLKAVLQPKSFIQNDLRQTYPLSIQVFRASRFG